MSNTNKKDPKVPPKTVRRLWVVAGGRCSFPGCNKYLLKEELTREDFWRGHVAHIVDRSGDGIRIDETLTAEDRNKIDNLILLCLDHHTMIDDDEIGKTYTIDFLKSEKKKHESRILELTGYGPEGRTKLISLTATIGKEKPAISYAQIYEALLNNKRFPTDRDGIKIDLTNLLGAEDDDILKVATKKIDQRLKIEFEDGINSDAIEHLSVFAIAPIPLLIYLGSKVSNKIPTDLYQRHRDTEDWKWKHEESKVEYKTNNIHIGHDGTKVALLLSLSGTIDHNTLPEEIDDSFSVYEVTLKNGTPNTDFLRTKEDLAEFGKVYREFWGMLRQDHPDATTVHLFPAVPAPVAVMCGREILHKIPHSLQVYDNNRESNGFKFALEVT